MAFNVGFDKLYGREGDVLNGRIYDRNDTTVTLELRDYYSPRKSVYWKTINSDTFSITLDDTWFKTAQKPGGELRLDVIIKSSDGRTHTSSNYIVLYRDPMVVTLSSDSVGVGEPNTLTITNPRNTPVKVKVCFGHNTDSYYLQEYFNIQPESIDIILSEDDSFVKYHNRFSIAGNDHDVAITVKVEDNTYGLGAIVSYRLTRPALITEVTGFSDPETSSVYAETGHPFTLRFTNRLERVLTAYMQAGYSSLYREDGTQKYYFSNDQVSVDCLKRWFDDAANTSTTSMVISITIYDDKYRRGDIKLEIRAGADMYPVVTVNTAPVQPETWPAALAAYYVQGYTRARFAAAVTAPTNAVITDVSLSSSQTGPLQLTYNSESERYEVVTKAPLTADASFTIRVQDQRGLVTTTPAATLSVLPYAFPGISVDSYHRCRADGTPDDSGGWCRMVISYSFSPLENLNEKDTALSTSGYSDERTLSAYSKTEIYLFEANTEHSYQILIRAVDLLNTVSRVVTLSTAGVIMDFLAGGKGIGLGKVAEIAECVEVNPEWKFKAAVIELNGTDLGTLLAQIQQRLTNGGL